MIIKDKFDRLTERVDTNNEKVRESYRKDLANMGECMAEDLYKPLAQAFDGNDKYIGSWGYGKKYSEGYDRINWGG